MIGAVGLAPVVAVGEDERGVAVAEHRGREHLAEVRPRVGAVQRVDDRREQRVAVDPAAVASAQRARVDRCEQAADLVDRFVDRAAERAVVAREAVLEVRDERPLEPDGLRLVDLERARRRVERPVEHETAHLLGVQVGVGGPEERAVRVAEVVELVVAEHGAQQVEVARGALGVDLREQVAGLFEACLAEGRVGRAAVLDPLVASAVVGVDAVEELVHCGGVVAGDGRRLVDAARVEPDDVEALLERLADREVDGVEHEVVARTAGPAGVDEQRADLVAGGRVARERQFDLAGAGVAPVERRLRGGAGHLFAARAPLEHLRVERLELGRDLLRRWASRPTARARAGWARTR